MNKSSKNIELVSEQEKENLKLIKGSKRCPYCGDNYFDQGANKLIDKDIDGKWYIFHTICPSCKKLVLYLFNGDIIGKEHMYHPNELSVYMVKPINSSGRPKPPKEIPQEIATDYEEACLILSFSPKASAALSRRCLQQVLNEKSGEKSKELAELITKVVSNKKLPTYLIEALDYVRCVGNFAAHPIKSKSSGEIINVEKGEAEWNLDTLELLFDFYYVLPELAKQKKEALNKKLQDAGKSSI